MESEFMLIGSRQRLSTVTVSPTLAINDFRVTQVATAKSLGVTIDDNRDWGSHMEKIITKVSSGIGTIRRVRHLVPQATLQLIYQALIHPHFNYCNTVWAGNCGIILRNKLQKLQNKEARFLTFLDYDEDAGYLLELLGWKNLAPQHEIEKATMVSKSLHGLAPEYLCSRFATRETAYNLRDSENKLCIPLPRTNYYNNSFSYSGVILWNKLPCNVRQAESLTKFKCLLKQVLKGTAFMESSFFFNVFYNVDSL